MATRSLDFGLYFGEVAVGVPNETDRATDAATGDTNQGVVASIHPPLTTEKATQAVFSRCLANLQARTEALRQYAEDSRYLDETSNKSIMSGGGNIVWNGTVANGGNGKFTISANLQLRPFLAPGTCIPATASFGGSGSAREIIINAMLTGANRPRDYGSVGTPASANKFTMEITGTPGGVLGITYDGTLDYNFHLNINSAATTNDQIITFLLTSGSDGAVAFRTAGLTA